MRFWDTSAIVPLFIAEPASEIVETLLKEDEGIVVWWATRVECTQPLNRRRREAEFSEQDMDQAQNSLEHLMDIWSEMQPTDVLRTEALRLMGNYPLRAADALQLAAAVRWRKQAHSEDFVCLDKNLRTAAGKEGFRILPEALID